MHNVELAHEALLRKLARIPGLKVSQYTSRPLGQPVFQVAVEAGNVEGETAVYQAELEAYKQFPKARLELYVI